MQYDINKALATIDLCERAIRMLKHRINKSRIVIRQFNQVGQESSMVDTLTEWFGSRSKIFVTVGDLASVSQMHDWSNVTGAVSGAMRELGFTYETAPMRSVKTRIWLRTPAAPQPRDMTELNERYVIEGDRLMPISERTAKYASAAAIPAPPL